MTANAVLLLIVGVVALGFLAAGVYLEAKGYGSYPGGDERGPEGGE